MSARIFIENATMTTFNLVDIDGNNFGQIKAGDSYSLSLNFSENFEKEYHLVMSNGLLRFWLSINGELIRVDTNVQPFTLLIKIETFLRPQLFNKLLITPKTNTFARSPPDFFPPVPDSVLRLDFTG